MKTIVVVLLIALVGMLACRENYSGPDASHQAMVNKCELRVSLGQKIDDVPDLRWAKLGSGEYQTYRLFTAGEKCEITVGLPSGKSFSYKPINIDLVQTEGQLDAIHLRLHPQVLA